MAGTTDRQLGATDQAAARDVVALEDRASSGFANTCFDSTVRHAVELGYTPTVIKDVTASLAREEMVAALDVNLPNYAAITAESEIVDALASVTGPRPSHECSHERPRSRPTADHAGGSMTTATTNVSVAREPRLLGQTVVVIGGSAGIGLETARLARSEGGEVVLTGRDPKRLEQAARGLSARSTAAFDADDGAAVKRFFDELPAPIDHVLIAAYTHRSYGPMLELPPKEVGAGIGRRVTQVLEIARNAAPKMRPGGTLLLTGGSQRTFDREAGITPAAFAVLPPFTAALALELAPIRVNLIQAGFVDTALATSYFADEKAAEARREELRATLPIGRVVGPADVAALAVHLMINTAVTGATYDIDGGQRLIA